jgi:formate dehydrogenase major subunit
VNRCEGVAFAGGAAFSSEEGYLATKLMRGLGVVYLEQQARV